MKQQAFEDRHQGEWQALADQLARLERRQSPAAGEGFPLAYRKLCAQLAVARERQYGNRLIDSLNGLALRGYQQLYRAPQGRLAALAGFLAEDFPRLVRAEYRLFWLCCALFYLPLATMGWLTYHDPALIYTLLDHDRVEQFEAMYKPGSHIAEERPAQGDVLMFGYYVYHNIGIGFRTFASGMVFGVGSVLVLLFNGVFFGAVAGYLLERGYAETFFPFVVAHGAFELTAIVLSAVAGIRLGLALLAPGRHTRAQALRDATAGAIRLIYGVIALLVLAAFLEAFWSSKDGLPSAVRYGVGAACWALVILYLWRGGRRAA